MVARVWHGWTTHENAGKYEHLLKNEIFPSIANKKVKGYRKVSLLKRELVTEVEFTTIMLFDDIVAVREFAGEDYQTAYVPESARKVLLRYDDRSQHYEVVHELVY